MTNQPLGNPTQANAGVHHRPGAHPAPAALGFNDRFAAELTRRVGSMWVVYGTTLFVLVWMALATFGPLHALDPYPFPFLLFLGNVVQLLLVFVILVGQQVLGKATDERALRTYTDAEKIFGQVTRLEQHLAQQDELLNRGISMAVGEAHPWIAQHKVTPPTTVAALHVGRNGRIGAWLTVRAGSMWAFYAATILQLGWMALATLGIISFDPYPFAFLLFLSSIAQLILMFVIMVGQEVLGSAGDQRAEQTYLDAEAVLHECERLQRHLTVQDKVISDICAALQTHGARAAQPNDTPASIAAPRS